jgi:hypothetical protein
MAAPQLGQVAIPMGLPQDAQNMASGSFIVPQ